jgi:integrase
MRWDELDGAEWTMPDIVRAKGVGGVLVLPAAAIAIIEARPQIGTNPYVFAGRGDLPFSSFTVRKRALDAKLGIASPWVLHDLRRSARSLMSRAGVRPDIAERVMGHVIEGVEGVYDRHHYCDEKGEALARLAALIDTIVSPSPSGNVVQLRDAAP